MELNTIESLLEEINYLKKKAALADKILSFYDKETMTFDLPEKWKSSHAIRDHLNKIAKSPRHLLMKHISEMLPWAEADQYVDWDECDKTAAE